MSGAPSSGTPRESQEKLRDGTMLVLVQVRDLVCCGYCCPLCPAGVQYSIRGKFVLLRNLGYKNGGEGGGAIWLNKT